MQKKTIPLLLIFALLCVAFFSLFVGSVPLNPFKAGQFSAKEELIFFSIRLPRILTCLAVGAGLSFSGTLLQALFRNPLADPSLIGVSAGSALAASCSIVLGWAGFQTFLGVSSLTFFSFLGAGLTSFFVYRLSSFSTNRGVGFLLLAGVAIQSLAFSLNAFLIYLSDNQQLRDLTFWGLGTLSRSNWSSFFFVSSSLLLAYGLMASEAKNLNVFAMGKEEASFLGVNTERLKWKVFLATTLLVGISTAFTGAIGFVGLVAPHGLRLWLGADNRKLLPLSLITGALLLLIADTLSRTLLQPVELPIGVLTSFIGAPVFFWILFHKAQRLKSETLI